MFISSQLLITYHNSPKLFWSFLFHAMKMLSQNDENLLQSIQLRPLIQLSFALDCKGLGIHSILSNLMIQGRCLCKKLVGKKFPESYLWIMFLEIRLDFCSLIWRELRPDLCRALRKAVSKMHGQLEYQPDQYEDILLLHAS